jgi:transcriptional regulator with XRE-family HTH domain
LRCVEAPRAIRQVREEIADQNAIYAAHEKPPHGGLLLRAMRNRKGLTTEEAARQIGVQPNTVRRWERGSSWPDCTLLHTLCRALAAQEDEIIVLTCGPGLGLPPCRFDEAREVALQVLRHTTRGLYGIQWLLALDAIWPFLARYREAQILLVCLYGDQARHLADNLLFEEARLWGERAVLLRDTMDVSAREWQHSDYFSWQGATLALACAYAYRERTPRLSQGIQLLQEGMQFPLHPQYQGWYLSEMARMLEWKGQPEAGVSVGKRSVAVAEAAGEPFSIYYRKAYQSRLLARMGRPGEAEAMWPVYPDRQVPASIRTREQVWEAERLLAQGEVARAEETLMSVYAQTSVHNLIRWEADQVRTRLTRE